MIYKVTVKSKTEKIELEAESGALLSNVLLSANFALPFDCSGNGLCGKCKVYAPKLEVGETDRRLLNEKEISDGIRLACAVKIYDNIEVELIEKTEYSNVKQIDAECEKIIAESVSIAVDIGTTTLALYAVDNSDGEVKGSVCQKNEQAKYGADVISRIALCRNDEKVELLHKTIINQIDLLISTLCSKYQIKPDKINKIVFVGNTTMLHLLMNKSPFSMGVSPYTPEFLESIECASSSLGIKSVNAVKAVVMPSISAFVGADITSAVLCSGMLNGKNTQLLIDIGTNAEMVLSDNGKYYACSASAGPAFEGAGIRCGMCACDGAIKRVSFINGEFICDVIGGKKAVGICGSGIINAVALLLKLGVIGRNGNISDDESFEDFVYEKDGVFGIWLTNDVVITNDDIHNIMLAKGAVSAGIKMLLKYAGKSIEDIDALYIAGAFGANIDIDDAITIGLIPKPLKSRAVQLGNAAGIGAAMVAFDENMLKKSQQFAVECNSINLSQDISFEDEFIKEISF